MKPYLLQVRQKFTSYSIYHILAMQSKYSIRLYELLKSFENLKYCDFDIEWFKMRIGAEKYKLFGHLKEKVLSIAMREVNDYGDIHVTYELEKQGRKFSRIKFSIKPKYNMGGDETLRVLKNIREKVKRLGLGFERKIICGEIYVQFCKTFF